MSFHTVRLLQLVVARAVASVFDLTSHRCALWYHLHCPGVLYRAMTPELWTEYGKMTYLAGEMTGIIPPCVHLGNSDAED